MCELIRKAPCYDCPFRKNATPGWLGASTPRQFLRLTLAEDEMPCHVDVDYTDPEWVTKQNEASFCAGSLIFFRNMMKSPRRPNLSEAVRNVQSSDKVFKTAAEFLEYHYSSGVHRLEPRHPFDQLWGLPDVGTDGTEAPENWNGDLASLSGREFS